MSAVRQGTGEDVPDTGASEGFQDLRRAPMPDAVARGWTGRGTSRSAMAGSPSKATSSYDSFGPSGEK